MSRRIIYRKQLLQAIEAFLEETPSSLVRAQHIIQRCYASINSEAKECTLDEIIWHSFIVALTDSVYYKSNTYLRETRELLLGQSSQPIARTIFHDDYRPSFTSEETEWYVQLVDLLDFIATIPFAKIYEATVHAWQNPESWAKMRKVIPEAKQAEEIEAEYQRRKSLIQTLAEKNPSPQNIGEETIYHIVLREATALLTGISVGRAAVYCGYPILDSPYTGYGRTISLAPGIEEYAIDLSDEIKHTRKSLDALAGKGGLFVSWRLSKSPTFGIDILLLSIH